MFGAVERGKKMKLLAIVSMFAAFGCSQIYAHGYLVQPLSRPINDNIDKTQYAATIDSYALFPDGIFNTDPAINVKSFVEHFKKSKYKTLKELIVENMVLVSPDATASCGFTAPEKTSYGALNDTLYWGRNEDLVSDEGFNHMGACESWCGDNRIQYNSNCQVAYASAPGASPVPIDNSNCTHATRLTVYWIAMHGAQWQVYIDCVNINGGTGGAELSSSTKAKTARTTPMATSVTPTMSSYNVKPTENVPKTKVTHAPEVKATAAPATKPRHIVQSSIEQSDVQDAPTSAKCSRRRIRG